MSELDWGWDEEDKAAIAEWKRKRADMTPEQEMADYLRKYSTYRHAGAEMIERLASEREALRAENERLRTAAQTLLAEWGTESWVPLVEGNELMTGYWSPAGKMLETSVVASLRAALERKPE